MPLKPEDFFFHVVDTPNEFNSPYVIVANKATWKEDQEFDDGNEGVVESGETQPISEIIPDYLEEDLDAVYGWDVDFTAAKVRQDMLDRGFTENTELSI
jgi:hypothetical protein